MAGQRGHLVHDAGYGSCTRSARFLEHARAPWHRRDLSRSGRAQEPAVAGRTTPPDEKPEAR